MPYRTFRKPQTLLMALLCAVAAFAAEPGAKQDSVPTDTSAIKYSTENTLSIVSIVLPHNSLRNSETLHNWPFFAFAAPSWAYSARAQYDASKLLTLKGTAGGDVSFAGLGLKLDISAELMHLLELGVEMDEPETNRFYTNSFPDPYPASDGHLHTGNTYCLPVMIKDPDDETIVPALIDSGYTLVTISELAEYKNVQLENGKPYFSMRG